MVITDALALSPSLSHLLALTLSRSHLLSLLRLHSRAISLSCSHALALSLLPNQNPDKELDNSLSGQKQNIYDPKAHSKAPH